MAKFEVILPPLGEDDKAPKAATVSFFYVDVGGTIHKEDPLVQMLTDKAAFDVPCPASGTVLQIVAKEDERVPVGGVLAILETDGV